VTTYDAGIARAVYDLDLTQFKRQIEEVRRIQRQLQQEQAARQQATRPASNAAAVRSAAELQRANASLAQQIARTEAAQAKAATTAASGYQRMQQATNAAAASAQKVAQAEQLTATATARRQTAEAALARSLAQAATAEQRRQTEAARTAAAQDNAASAALRRQAAEARAARAGENGGTGPALPRTFAGFTPGGLNQALGAFGLATLGPQVVASAGAAAVDAGRQSLALQQTLNLTKELSGSQQVYNQVIAAAREQQALYGGTLQETVQGLSGLVVSARSSGASLETLINLSQRLAVLDPAQGAEGARIALSEVLAGDPASLARRYEIPRSALEQIKDTSLSVEERLGILDGYLTKIGITSEVAGDTITEQAKAFNRLGAELDALTTNTGGGLADFFEESATGLSRLVGLINSNPQALAELRALAERRAVTQTDVAEATQLTQRQNLGAQLKGSRDPIVGANLFGGGEQFQQVLDRILAIQAAGGPAAEAVAKLNAEFAAGTVGPQQFVERLAQIEQFNVDPLIAIGAASRNLSTDFQAGADGGSVLTARMTELSGTSDANRLAVISLAEGYSQYVATNGEAGISAAELAASIAALEQQERQLAQTSEETKAAVTGLTEEQRTNILAKAEATAETQRLADAEAAIAGIGGQVQAGLITAAQGADILAARYGFATDEALRLLNAQAALAGAKAVKVSFADQRAAERSGGEVVAGSEAKAKRDAEAARIASQKARAAEEARRDQLVATGNAAQVAAVRQQEYNDAVTRFGAGSAEAIRAETALIQSRQSGAKAAGGGGGGGKAPKVSAAEKERDQLLDIQRDLGTKLEDIEESAAEKRVEIERTAQERRLEIAEEYGERRREAETSFGDAQIDDRRGFYRALRSLDEDARAAASAEYEQVQLKAAELATTEGADVAEKYLSEISKIIRDRATRQAEIAQALKDGNEGDAEYLRGLDAMDRQAEDRSIERITKGEGSLKSKEADALGDVEAQRQKALGEADQQRQQAIGDAAEKAGLRVTDAELKKKTGIDATNLALAEQLRLQSLLGGGAAPAPAPAVLAPASPTQQPAAVLAPATVPAAALDPAAAGAGLALPAVEARLDALAARVDVLVGQTARAGGLLEGVIRAEEATARSVERLGVRTT
jgi:hypothetical protein